MAHYMVSLEDGSHQDVTTLAEVKKLLGVSKVSKKDIEEGKYPQVSLQPEPVAPVAGVPLAEEPIQTTLEDIAEASEGRIEIVHVGEAPTNTEDEVVAEEPKEEVLTNTEDTDPVVEEPEVVEPEPAKVEEPVAEAKEEVVEHEDMEYPEVGHFEDEKAIKKYIKKLTNEQLQEWVELEGAEYKHNDNPSINRMRMAMAIKSVHFPELAKPAATKKKSKYAQYSTEDLVQMAMDNEIIIKDDKGDMRILRMYAIMALRNAGIIE